MSLRAPLKNLASSRESCLPSVARNLIHEPLIISIGSVRGGAAEACSWALTPGTLCVGKGSSWAADILM